jgi:hypothetical protein
MNFSLKAFKEEYPEIIKTMDTKAIVWVSKNKKACKDMFKEMFPKATNDFVVQIATNRGSKLLVSDGTIKDKKSGAYLSFEDLEELGYEME